MIRNAKESDRAKLREIRPSLTEEEISERLNIQSKGEAEYLVVEEDGQIVSFVLLKWNGKKSHSEYPDMEDLYTKESERGKGYGTSLILECERLAKEKGFKKIGLAVNPTLNNPAKMFYEKLGYKHDGKRTYVDGIYDGIEDWVIDLEKELI